MKTLFKSLTILACLGVVALLSWAGLHNPFLWFDESGQFWISLGLNHYSDTYATPGGIAEVIEGNRHYNLDPGGFSLLLYLWLKICNDSIVFLRLLPFLFFAALAVFTFWYTYRSRKNIVEACLYTTLLFVWEVTANEMTEVRAYSMEMCGVVSTMCFLPALHTRKNIRSRLFLLSVWLSFFCLSRYDFFIFAFSTALWVLSIVWLQRKSWGDFFGGSVLFAAPLLLTVGAVLLGITSHQEPAGAAVTYQYIGTNPKVIFSPLVLFALANVLLIVRDIVRRERTPDTHILFLIVFSVYFVLSALSLYPLDSRGSIGLTILLTITLLERLIGGVKIPSLMKFLIILALCRLSQHMPISDYGSLSLDSDVLREYVRTKENHKSDKVFIDYWMAPTIRHLYEYGDWKELAEQDGYPSRFCIQQDSDTAHVVMPDEVECDYYIITRHTKMTKQYDMSPFRPVDDEAQYIYVKTKP